MLLLVDADIFGMGCRVRLVAARMPASVVALVLIVGVVAALRLDGGSVSATAKGVVTPTEAQIALETVWAKREMLRTRDNKEGLATVDTGPELARDMSVSVWAHDSGEWSQRVRRPISYWGVSVPLQTTFPASFLAAVQTSSQWSRSPASHTPEGQDAVLLVFTKTSRSAPWRVTMETSYAGTIWKNDLGLHLTDFAGATTYAAPAPQPAWTRPANSIAMLASYYQHYADYGEAPPESPFLGSRWTTGQGEQIAAPGLNGQVSSRGFRDSITYSSDSADGVYQFDVEGMNLTCGTVRGQDTATAARPGGYLYQSADRSNWGGWLAPGAYSEITSSLMHQVCLVVAPTSLGGIKAISGDDEESALNATGTPLSESRSGQAQ